MKSTNNKMNIKFALNMETILMVKPDKSLISKTGYFYLFLTTFSYNLTHYFLKLTK